MLIDLKQIIETFLLGGIESILSNNINVTPTMMDETVGTPGGKVDKKREATSPLILNVTVMEKKTRHVSGDGASALVPFLEKIKIHNIFFLAGL